jgi:hypothetical protein
MPSVEEEEESSGVVVEGSALLTLSGLFSVAFVVVVVVVVVEVLVLDASAAAVSISISRFCGLLSDDNVTWTCMDASALSLACVLSAI